MRHRWKGKWVSTLAGSTVRQTAASRDETQVEVSVGCSGGRRRLSAADGGRDAGKDSVVTV